MELTLTAGCWIKFVRSWQKLYASIITTICFTAPLLDRFNDRLLPLLRQFFLIPNILNKFLDLRANCATPCINQLVLLVFDQYLAICVFLAFQFLLLLFSWRYKPLWLYFHSPVAGFSLLFFRGFLITHNDAPQSVGLPWTSDQLVAETSI